MVIVYGYENDKLWFGQVTFRSWFEAFYRNGRSLEVRPIRGYKNYSYFSKGKLYTSIDTCNMTNIKYGADIFSIINFAERNNGGLKTTKPMR